MITSRVKLDFEYVDPCLCNAWVATAVVGSAVIGAGASIWSANKAADTQSENAQRVADMQQQQYQQSRSDLSPYRDIGADASGRLTSRLSELTTPISVNPDDFLNSDYYKFLETQGQKAVTNSSAARGLGSSGAALKGAAAFAKGLNSQEWKSNFEMQRANKTDAFSRLKSLVDTGQTAAAGGGALGAEAAKNAGTALTGGANAEAAAYNSIGSSVSKAASDLGGWAAYKGMYSPLGQIALGGPSGPGVFS